jgi:hypothetical protein
MHELVLIEIIAVPAERGRGRHNPRVVKRKMSNFPTKARAAPTSSPGRLFHYQEHVRVVAPAGSPVAQGPPPAATPEEGPRRRRPKKASAPPRHAIWLEHVRSWHASGLPRAAFCERRGLNPRAFHQWVARSRQIFRPSKGRGGYS